MIRLLLRARPSLAAGAVVLLLSGFAAPAVAMDGDVLHLQHLSSAPAGPTHGSEHDSRSHADHEAGDPTEHDRPAPCAGTACITANGACGTTAVVSSGASPLQASSFTGTLSHRAELTPTPGDYQIFRPPRAEP